MADLRGQFSAIEARIRSGNLDVYEASALLVDLGTVYATLERLAKGEPA